MLALLYIYTHTKYVFPGSAAVKSLPTNARDTGRCWFGPWVGNIPWKRKSQPTPVFLPGKSHERSLVGYSPKDLKELDGSEQQNTHT